MIDYIGIKVAGGKIKQILDVDKKVAKRIHCNTIKNNQNTLKIDFFIIKTGKNPKSIGNLVVKDLNSLSKGDNAADLVLRMDGTKLLVYVKYKPEGIDQHFSVNFNTDISKNTVYTESDKTNKYLQYGTYISPDILTPEESDARTIEEQINDDIEEDIFIEEELEKKADTDKSVVQDDKNKKKKGFSFLKLILFFFYGIFAAALILLLVALTFKEVSINEIFKMIGINLNINF